MDKVSKAAQILGSIGGLVKSPAKTEAARRNASKPRGKRKVKKAVDTSQAVC